MRNSSGADVFDHYLHLRVVGEAPILLFESEMCGVKMHNERRGALGILLKDVGGGFYCGDPTREKVSNPRVYRGLEVLHPRGDSPYGSGNLLDTRLSFPCAAVRVNGRPSRADASPGLCDWFRVRFSCPLGAFATLSVPFVRLGLDPTDIVPGRFFDVTGGDEEGC